MSTQATETLDPATQRVIMKQMLRGYAELERIRHEEIAALTDEEHRNAFRQVMEMDQCFPQPHDPSSGMVEMQKQFMQMRKNVAQ